VIVSLGLLAIAMTASCTRGETKAAVPEVAAEFHRGGVLRLLVQAPLTLDPVESTSVYESIPVNQLFDSLVDLGPDLAIAPSLADSWTISANNLVYTFDLRPHVRFHDGSPLTADDVAFSLTRAAISPYGSFLSMVEGTGDLVAGRTHELAGIEVLNPSTIRIRLSRPSLAFLETLSMDGMKVLPKNQFISMGAEAFARMPIGTGPFQFGSWDADALELIRNDGYHNGAPLLDGLRIEFLSDATTGTEITERWFEGEIDVTDVPLLEAVRFQRDPGTTILRYSELSLAFLGLVQTTPPLDNRLVRQAIASAIDRDRLTQDSDATRRAAGGALPPGLQGYSPDPKGLVHDPQAARERLVEAGYPGGKGLREINVLHSGVSASTRLMLRRISEDLAAVDIRLVSRRVNWSELNERIEEGRADMFLLAWVADLTDPDTYLRGLFHSDASSNFFAYRDPATDRLLDEAAQEENPQIRSVLYRDLENRILNDVPMVPLFHSAACLGVRTRVRGLEPSPLGLAAVRFEKVWLAPEDDTP
jgi:ABC-type transport system substrate-binding protein